MNKIIFFFIFIILTGCSLNNNSKFWSKSEKISQEANIANVTKSEEILKKSLVYEKEFNQNLKIKLEGKFNKKKQIDYLTNNNGRVNFDGNLKTLSKYKFSKIKNFYEYEPEISFLKDNLIFFDNKGTILQFDKDSKLLWKKNYYSKSEKKQNPILQFANNNEYIIIADNIAKYYLLDANSGRLIWKKNNLAPFNSQIKIYEDKFFIVDFSNTLRCFSLKNGDELWSITTDNSLIRSKKKLSLVIDDGVVYFNNSLGDITAIDIKNKNLLWQLATQSSLIYESAFSLETSEIVVDNKNLFFSNNKNQFFSIDIQSGSFNWENKINSNLRSIVVDNFLLTITIDGFLVITEKKSGNIIRVTDTFSNIKTNKRKKIKPTGFVVGLKNIYLSTNNGRLLVIDLQSGKTISTLKIDNEKISRPSIIDKNLFVIKDNAIIKLN